MENETQGLFYQKIHSFDNLILAWRNARKGKTKKDYVIEFEKDTIRNLLKLQEELKNQTYYPKPLNTFILRDPKTRKISKSDFRDRIVHHALIRTIGPIFDKGFIYDSCANRIGKGNLFAVNRFDVFKRKVTNNLKTEALCLKADIKHYFEEVNHGVLMEILCRKVKDEKVLWLIKQILRNISSKNNSESYLFPNGMPLGNLTSQFFANLYLHELDYFVKHILKVKYYIRYVDDFVIFHEDVKQLEEWRFKIDKFLRNFLKIELHPQKSRIISLSNGIDFIGFRNFYYHRLLRKRNMRKILSKIKKYKKGELSKKKVLESFQGWNAYASWANSYKLRKRVVQRIYSNK
jgi:RNA-directed DNA polymerase